MSIPTMHVFFLPILHALKNGAHNARTALSYLKNHFGFTDEEMEVLVPSATRERVFDRADWAIFHLMKAGLVDRPKRGVYQLSKAGADFIAGPETVLDRDRIEQFPAYQAFRAGMAAKPTGNDEANQQDSAIKAQDLSTEQTPEDSIAAGFKTLNTALRDDLLAILYDMNPIRFERLILDLLTAMGYGKGDLANSHTTKASGDGGIDGIIFEDALGLDAVYIQAKRYASENKISRPAIQQFVGSLNGEGATKGVFVTTSDFSAEARGFLGKVQHRVVLINGQELARLMIKYGIGVRARTTYVIKSVDEDYFGEA
jgi:restriction system protein